MINLEFLSELRDKKLLLAFSHGSDSTALFHLLLQANISFDCALFNYKTRDSSDLEEASAKELCERFDKRFFSKSAELKNGNFESKARALRYDFFKWLCLEHGYEGLVLAHQLNDYFEWFLMRFSKGAGLANLLGFDESLRLENGEKINIYRPLKNTPKHEILAFLRQNNIKYFNDESNKDESFERNYIRANFSDKFIASFAAGVARTFEALNADKKVLLGDFAFEGGGLFVLKNDEKAINLADKALKKLGVLLSADSRAVAAEAMKNKRQIVLSHKVALCANRTFVFIAPLKTAVLKKEFKEECRVLKIPSKIRAFLFLNKDIFKDLKEFLS